MIQGKNEGENAPASSLVGKINHATQKTKSLFSSARIHRVPEDLRKLNESAYTPRVIAIGPLHQDKEHLQKPMQDVKMYYTYYLLARLAEGMEDTKEKGDRIDEVLQECVTKMNECLDKAKKYYAEELKVNDEKMAEMMVVDGCFILELLYASNLNKKSKQEEKETKKGEDSGNSKGTIHFSNSSSVPRPINGREDGSSDGGGDQPKADPIFDSILTADIVKHDLLLLENQIPFFVLEELFKLTVDKIPKDQITGEDKLPLTEYVVLYFRDIISPEGGENSGSEKKTGCCSPSDCVLWVNRMAGCCCTKEIERENGVSENKYYHILHLLHEYYSPGDQGENKNLSTCCLPRSCITWHTQPLEKNSKKKMTELKVHASDLEHAGVRFVPGKAENLFNVKFVEDKGLYWWCRKARFEIRTLDIHEPTELFLRNLIAFEQLCPRVSRHFTSYAKLMDMLINSKEDFQVLQKSKVIHNYLGSDKNVSDLFNNLCKEVVHGEFYFKGACQKASKYSECYWPKFMAYLKRKYFASRWKFIALCLGLVILGFQIYTHFFITIPRASSPARTAERPR